MNINEYSEQYIKFLTENFINSTTAQISNRVVENVSLIVNQFDVKLEIDKQINSAVSNAISAYKSVNHSASSAIGETIVSSLQNKSQEYLDQITADIKTRVIDEFKSKVAELNIINMVRDQVNDIVNTVIKEHKFQFFSKSIPLDAIQIDNIEISGDKITPGIIKRFSSTGIEDISSSCQLTITDPFTILENKLITQDVEVRGKLIVNGSIDSTLTDLIARSAVTKIEQTYSDGTYDQYVHRVLTKISTEGINSSSVKVQDRPIVENNGLNSYITVSNLRKLGLLVELEVDGETLLDNTLYVRSGKMGLNTTEPQYTLDFWDQEVQLIATKRERDAAFFGTVKPQRLVIGTNTRDQLVLLPNGDIEVESITIGKIRQASAAWQPTDNRQIGTIVWNEQPKIGDPIGWVSLGGARWARFGTITE